MCNLDLQNRNRPRHLLSSGHCSISRNTMSKAPAAFKHKQYGCRVRRKVDRKARMMASHTHGQDPLRLQPLQL